MLKDRAVIWVLEYIVGGVLVLVPLAALGFSWFAWQRQPPVFAAGNPWIDAHIWAGYLFVICLGVTLLSCASSMRQRMLLAKWIDSLAKQMQDHCSSLHEPARDENQTDRNQNADSKILR